MFQCRLRETTQTIPAHHKSTTFPRYPRLSGWHFLLACLGGGGGGVWITHADDHRPTYLILSTQASRSSVNSINQLQWAEGGSVRNPTRGFTGQSSSLKWLPLCSLSSLTLSTNYPWVRERGGALVPLERFMPPLGIPLSTAVTDSPPPPPPPPPPGPHSAPQDLRC